MRRYKIFGLLLMSLLYISCTNGQQVHTKEQIERALKPGKVGETLPNTSWIISENGDTVSYSDHLKGKWLLIDYWTAGCIPCIKEFPYLDNYYKSIDTTKLEIISLSVDNKKKRWLKAKNKYKFSMPKYYAGTDSQNPFLAINFQLMQNKDGGQRIVTLTPQYVLIDPNGHIVDKNIPKPSDPKFGEVMETWIDQ